MKKVKFSSIYWIDYIKEKNILKSMSWPNQKKKKKKLDCDIVATNVNWNQ